MRSVDLAKNRVILLILETKQAVVLVIPKLDLSLPEVPDTEENSGSIKSMTAGVV